MDHTLYLGLALRNLALAEAQGYDEILAPCAACYHRLASAHFETERDPDLLSRINSEANLNYGGKVKVRNILDFLANVLKPETIAAKVTKPLDGLKVACYYGCLNTRVPRMEPFDDRAYPTSMDRIVQTLGAQALDWSYKTDCCGASLFVTAEPVAVELVAKILKDAAARGADCIAVACPLCHNNLDTKQSEIRAEYGIARPIPVLFISQLIGLAFGLEPAELNLEHNFVPVDSLELTAS
jgi:heterodisulfide reductase subunit B